MRQDVGSLSSKLSYSTEEYWTGAVMSTLHIGSHQSWFTCIVLNMAAIFAQHSVFLELSLNFENF